MRALQFLVGLIQLVSTGAAEFSQQTGASTILQNTAQSNGLERQKAIVVGGGPVGFASAIMLANEGFDVSVFEASQREQMKTYNPVLAYVYGISSKGQWFTKMFPNIHEKLLERSLPTSKVSMMMASGDTTKPIEFPKSPFSGSSGSKRPPSYFIQRHELNAMFWDSVDDHNKARKHDKTLGEIRFEPGMKCVNVHPSNADEDSYVTVTVQNVETGNQEEISGNLVVGADGINSKVRECLKEKQGEFGTWGYKAKKFELKKRTSPATGLRLKTLQLPTDRYTIKESDGSKVATKNNNFVLVKGAKTGPLETLSFPSFPMKDSSKVRHAQCITRPNHVLWTLKTGPEVKSWFEENYPRIDFDDLVTEKEWERFAQARGLTFPPCSYCPALQASSKNGECGIVLLGDAAHSFSPDIGQGINAGLADVVQFRKIMADKSGKSGGSLGAVLKEYERVQAPETKALVRIARVASPYQFGQPLLKDKIGRTLWTVNLATRVLLNKVTFGMFPKPMMLMCNDPVLSYRQVARRADLGTGVLFSMIVALLTWSLRLVA